MSCTVVNSENFKNEVIEENAMPVLVDFWATWCQPCKMLSPIVEEVANELKGKVKICKLNCDEARDTAIEHSVMSIPTLLLFNQGSEKGRLVGLNSKEDILSFIEKKS